MLIFYPALLLHSPLPCPLQMGVCTGENFRFPNAQLPNLSAPAGMKPVPAESDFCGVFWSPPDPVARGQEDGGVIWSYQGLPVLTLRLSGRRCWTGWELGNKPCA